MHLPFKHKIEYKSSCGSCKNVVIYKIFYKHYNCFSVGIRRIISNINDCIRLCRRFAIII